MSEAAENSKRHWPLPLLVAGCALIGSVLTIDSSGAVPQLGEGPGLTLDETFNVQMGVYHVRSLREYGFALFHPDSLQEVFGNPAYNPDHPPLGRLLIGIAHELSAGLLNPDVPPDSVCVTCGRFAAAGASALTLFLIGWVTTRWYGRAAGLIASVSMVLMPRLFAHGHIASLESFVNLTYVATVLWIADRWNTARPPGKRIVLVGGVLFGLCLLTKIQAVLLPIPIGIWSLWRWRMRGVLPMLGFGLVGFVVFFAGWPWLWLDPWEHLAEYFGRSTGRQTLYCWYLGQKWSDTEVPWHYAAVMFAVTVPLGLQLLGFWGVLGRNKEDVHSNAASRIPPAGFLVLNVLWPLVFFALPGITNYDGCRLFLMAFPLWAILIGRGGGFAWKSLSQRWGTKTASISLGLFLAAQSYGVIAMHPVQLSYYNLTVGGLGGAKQLGFEATYWGDSVTRSFLKHVGRHAEGQRIDVAPVLHPFQLQEWQDQWPGGRPPTVFTPFNGIEGAAPYVIVFRRYADSWEELTPSPDRGRLLAEIRRDGVQLAAIYELPPPSVEEASTAEE